MCCNMCCRQMRAAQNSNTEASQQTRKGPLRDAGASQGPPKSVPRPPGLGPAIVLHTKRPWPCLTSRRPRARSRDPRAGPQICPSPKQSRTMLANPAMAVKPSEKPCAPAVSQFKTAYKCCFKASQPTVHSSGAIFVKRRESSQKPCVSGVSLLLGRLYTAWDDFLPLPCFAVCRRGWADFTPGGSR